MQESLAKIIWLLIVAITLEALMLVWLVIKDCQINHKNKSKAKKK